MNQAAALIDRYYSVVAGEVCVGGIPVSELASHYGTPFFVYDREIIDKKWKLLRDALPAEFSICYSVKANPNATILQRFIALGAGLEVASAGEFWQAAQAGCPPERIVFAGPGKTESEIGFVLREGIGEIHAESVREIRRIASIAGQQSVRARIALRVNPGAEAEGGAMRMGGRPAPFGIDEECLDEALDEVMQHSDLDFRGLHLFTGTQILDWRILLDQYEAGLAIGRRAAGRTGKPLHTLDFGGGLGIPYFPHERELEMDKLAAGLESLIAATRQDPFFSGTQFFLEPGRYLVGEAGVYVTRVSDVKVSRGKKFAIADGGMHHHLAASGNLGQTIKRNYPVAVLNKTGHPCEEEVDICGPLCTPLDVLARGLSVPAVEPGDLIGVFQSGAYARSASPLGFLSHPSPCEIWTEGGRHRQIRRRGEYGDYIRDQFLTPAADGAPA